MRLFIPFILFVLFSVNINASEPVFNGIIDSLKSKILKESRNYYVYLPPSYESSKAHFPVVYVLDGDQHRWQAITGVIEGLSTGTLQNQIHQAIVIAIPNTYRSRDLTPTELPTWTFEGNVLETFEYSGGAANYLQFMQDELIPHIESQYRTTKKRILVGESFGGLFAAYTLLSKPELFSDYLIIDPTAVWDDNFLNKEYQRVGFNQESHSLRAYFAFANNSELGNIGLTNKRWGQSFASKLEAQASKDFHIKQDYFENETHGTVAFLAWYNGFKYLLPNTSN